MIIEFLVRTFINKQSSISSENIHSQLADFLEGQRIEIDEENEINFFDTYEEKAKKYIQKLLYHFSNKLRHTTLTVSRKIPFATNKAHKVSHLNIQNK